MTQDTGSLWMKMFGLGPLMEAIKDPNLVQNMISSAAAIMQAAQAQARIEAKLDLLLRQAGVDVDGLNARVAEQFGRRTAAVLDGHANPGDGSNPAPGVATHNGSGKPAPTTYGAAQSRS